jgi:hypothetical protein
VIQQRVFFFFSWKGKGKEGTEEGRGGGREGGRKGKRERGRKGGRKKDRSVFWFFRAPPGLWASTDILA